ncbi:MAG: proline--tRNA ligase [Candidatus Aenigmarchaeota archaeon]|nr:proline--tRNA ligase [Candidatus Aenigmarchaeota archaeon]
MAEQEGITCKKADLSEWYNEAVLKAGLADFSAVKGFMFIRPYGYGIWEQIQAVFNAMLFRTGHVNAYAPALIPERFLRKEKEHVEGFAPEMFLVTESGSGKLDERLVLRPTSETVIYDAYAKWVRSWRDLPILYNYWNSVFRAEIKSTKLFLRTCEFLWQEGHTVHATEDEAMREVLAVLELYRQLAEEVLAVPVVLGRKTEREKFAGAATSTCIEAMMPDGRALQMGTSHHLGQNFSKAFDIAFLDQNQQRQFAWQASWGVSTRLIGAVVMTHGDDRGLILPPAVAPYQAVIVPIFKDDTKAVVLKEARRLAETLAVRVHVDDRDGYSPGWKFNEWEMKGVPLRIEVGPKDLEKRQAVLVRRDTGAKSAVPLATLHAAVAEILEDIQHALLKRAKKLLADQTHHVQSFKDLEKTLEEKRGFLVAGWCQSRTCEDHVKDKTGADIRVVPFEPISQDCVICGKPGIQVYFAKAY